eukprot:4124-Amphidinium_carterae.1
MHKDCLADLADMSDTLRLWHPRLFGPSHCFQASAVVLALSASYGGAKPSLDSVMRVLHLSRSTDSEILWKSNHLKFLSRIDSQVESQDRMAFRCLAR